VVEIDQGEVRFQCLRLAQVFYYGKQNHHHLNCIRWGMKGKRRAHSDKFKAKIAIEAIKGIKTLSELATEYKIHPNQISTWKKQLQMNAAELFPMVKKVRQRQKRSLQHHFMKKLAG